MMRDRDYEWFLENYQVLFEEYGCSYIVIKDATVLGAYNTYGEAVRSTSKTEKLGTFLVQYCNGQESGYTNYISSMNFM